MPPATRTPSSASSVASTSSASYASRPPIRRPKNHFHMDDSGGYSKPQSDPQKSRFSDLLLLRRLRLSKAKTATASSLSDSLSDSLQQQQLRGVNSSSGGSLVRTHSGNSARSHRSTRSNATTLTAVSSLAGSTSTGSSTTYNAKKGKLRRFSKYEEEFSDGQLGINEKELNSMNKHIPALKSYGKAATFRQHYYPEGGWGWVIVLCCFLVNIFTYGLQLSFSLLQLEVIKYCYEQQQQQVSSPTSQMQLMAAAAAAAAGQQQGSGSPNNVDVIVAFNRREMRLRTAWIGSTNLGLSHILAPLVVALCRRKSTRLTAVVGGLIMALSLLFASFARFFHQIFLSYSILFGVGNAMVRETSTLMLSQYFKRRREMVEMWSSAGTGVGIAIFTHVYYSGLGSLGWRFGLQAITACIVSLFFLGLFYRSASLYHPQRRAILHLKDMSKRKGKDKNKMENKPPYFDFSSLRSRSFQIILLATSFCHVGAYSPLFYFIPMSLDEGLGQDAVLLQTFLGLATSLGSLLFGAVALSKSAQCMISRQYLLQSSMFGIAVSLLALTSVKGYHGYLLFVWMYGTFLGGFQVALSVYTLERMRMRHFPRAWGFVQGAKGIPFLLGVPVNGYINEAFDSPKAGYYFSFACVLMGALSFFVLECCAQQSKGEDNGHTPMCKEASIMTNGGSSNDVIMQELGSDAFRPRYSSASGSGNGSQSNHARCTCEDHEGGRLLPFPPFPPQSSSVMRRLSWNGSGAAIGAALLSPAIVLAGTELIEEVDEEEEDEDDLEERLKTTAFCKPELLTCISEENIVENVDERFNENGFSRNGRILQSFSEPDLVRLFDKSARSPRRATVFDSPTVKQEEEEELVEARAEKAASVPLSRQKTWHYFKSFVESRNKTGRQDGVISQKKNKSGQEVASQMKTGVVGAATAEETVVASTSAAAQLTSFV